MMVLLQTMVDRLTAAVPARNGVPDEDQYERAVTEAVADFGRRNSMLKVVTLSVAAGTASYALPDGFLRLVRLSATNAGGLMITNAGLVPTGRTSVVERYTIAGGQITFTPMPQYSADKEMWYSAGYVLDDDLAYGDMDEATAAVVLLSAQSRCVMLQASRASQEAWQYAVGDERVNKERLADSLRAQAEQLQKLYLAEVAAVVGNTGTRAGYADYAVADGGLL